MWVCIWEPDWYVQGQNIVGWGKLLCDQCGQDTVSALHFHLEQRVEAMANAGIVIIGLVSYSRDKKLYQHLEDIFQKHLEIISIIQSIIIMFQE